MLIKLNRIIEIKSNFFRRASKVSWLNHWKSKKSRLNFIIIIWTKIIKLKKEINDGARRRKFIKLYLNFKKRFREWEKSIN